MSESCLFCRIAHGGIPAQVVYEDGHCIAFLDIDPLFPGHTLVIPKEHAETITDLPSAQVGPLFEMAQKITRAVELATDAGGSFLGINNRISQSVPHLHIHVVPRRRKDGLRGFFWPRKKYESEQHLVQIAERIREKLAEITEATP